jgi:hypothetical protein
MIKSIVILLFIFQVSFSFARNNKSWFDMDSTQQEVVKAAYYQNTETAINARAVLALTKGLKYMRYPYDLAGGERRSIPINSNNTNLTKSANLKIYPNPANDEIKIAFSKLGKGNNILKIFNAQGLPIQEVKIAENSIELFYSVKEYTSGLYLFMLVNENTIIDKTKLLIAH